MKRNVPLKIVASLVGPIVKSEDRLTAVAGTPPDLEPALRGKRTEAAGECDSLHQGGLLSYDIRARPDDLAGNEYLGLEIIFRNIWFGRGSERNRNVKLLIFVIWFELI